MFYLNWGLNWDLNVNIGKSTSKVIVCLEQNIQKQIDLKRPSNTKQMSRAQNIRIKMRKYKTVRKTKYNQLNLALAVFASALFVSS